jgi:DNA-directed RNA polymerase specialized sigma24 family protein
VATSKVLGAWRLGTLTGRLRDELRVWPIAPESNDDAAITALASLSARDQELVTLVVWEGLSIAEVGSIIGIRPEAARARYSRARRSLRERLSRDDRSWEPVREDHDPGAMRGLSIQIVNR